MCNPGEVAVGGGGSTHDSEPTFLVESGPTPGSGATPTGWQVIAARVGGAGSLGVQAFVVCAAP